LPLSAPSRFPRPAFPAVWAGERRAGAGPQDRSTLAAIQSIPSDPDFGVRVAAQDAWKQIVARVGPPPKNARGKAAAATGSGKAGAPGR
jgi:hypothetical protein